MLADCHMHTRFSTDSETPVHVQIEKAIELGIRHICITDHMDMDFPQGEFYLDTEPYAARVLELGERYREKIRVCLGVEIGMQKHLHDRILAYVNAWPFDYVIGSMHLIDGEDPYEKKIFDRLGCGKALERYFIETLEALKHTEGIMALGHLDYAVRYCPDREIYSYARYADWIDAILKELVCRGIALEVNTAGYRSLPQPNPHPDVIRRYRELGGEMITVGADAHIPEHIGFGFDRAEALLMDCGFRYYTVFRGKKPQFLPLS